MFAILIFRFLIQPAIGLMTSTVPPRSPDGSDDSEFAFGSIPGLPGADEEPVPQISIHSAAPKTPEPTAPAFPPPDVSLPGVSPPVEAPPEITPPAVAGPTVDAPVTDTPATDTPSVEPPVTESDAAEPAATEEPGETSGEDEPESSEAEPTFPQLSESHVLGGMMIPHHSDGSTEVLVRGREDDDSGPFPTQDSAGVEEFSAAVPVAAAPADKPAADDSSSEPFPSFGGPAGDAGKAASIHDSEIPNFAPPVATTPSVAAPPNFDPLADTAPSIEFIPAAAATGASTAAATAPTTTSPSTAKRQPDPQPKGNMLIPLLISYASAVTIALIYLILQGLNASPPTHQLESLPDPIDEEGTVRIIERGADLPYGHTLELASQQRFGNILFEPLRLTRGSVDFVHFAGDTTQRKPSPSPPVLKLWVRLTNVSKDQEIAPLDAQLLYKRAMNQTGVLVANNFIRRVDQPASDPVVFTYPASQHSEWDMRDQPLGRTLKPGETMELYIPSDWEGLSQLDGSLVWRIHLRKGYAKTGRGVTTLVDVVFNSSDIQTEPPLPAAKPPAKSSRSARIVSLATPLSSM